jgi:predicted nucleic acid-binding protein
MIVLDTNVVSALMRPERHGAVIRWLDGCRRSGVWTTVVTLMEIRHGLERLDSGQRRRLLKEAFRDAIDVDLRSNVLPFTSHAAELAGELGASRQKSGRKIDRNDTMIAGIALSVEATLATRNTGHFHDLPLPLVDPWSA